MNALARLLAVAVCALALGACTNDVTPPSVVGSQAAALDLAHLTCLVDPRLSAVTEDIIAAMDLWSKATDGQVACTFVIGTGLDHIENTLALRYESAADLAAEGKLASTIGFIGKIESTTFIPDDMGEFEGRALLHEIGHALGRIERDTIEGEASAPNLRGRSVRADSE